MTIMEKFIEILKTDHDKAFDFIANNAWNFSKDELKDIIKELLYAIYSEVDDIDQKSIFECAVNELEEWYTEAQR